MSAAEQHGTRPGGKRILAFDGLRGVAAFTVVIYHFLCLLYPRLTPSMSPSPANVVDTPFHILWNGAFAVAVFFVLSGFVMAAATDRRPSSLWSNTMTRYLRLAIPAAASCILAWIWLSFWPTASVALAQEAEQPSDWLEYTYQDDVKTLGHAIADGLIANFVRGYSEFNNVLWTLQYEFVGSVGIFLTYCLTSGRARLLLLIASATLIVVFIPGLYLAFPLGAGIYEARKRGWLDGMPAALPALALTFGLMLGYPGEGAHERLDMAALPVRLQLGAPRGLIIVVAASLLVYAALALRPLARLLSRSVPQWLGRISFGLYLVHVPPLYTIVAWSHVEHQLHPVLLGGGYFIGVLVIAHLFTLLVDEPTMQRLPALRTWVEGARRA